MGALHSNRASDREIAAATCHRSAHVAIIGGGASGSLMALALTRTWADLEITLIEPSQPGAGLAYGTSRPEHRLNVLPRRLSAFSDKPDDFAEWLVRRGQLSAIDEKAFVARRLMAAYLAECLEAAGSRLSILPARVTAIDLGVKANLQVDSDAWIRADAVILATGHSWGPSRDEDRPVAADAAVTILGTGLGMVDRWLALREAGHRGVITAISRHRLVPLDHGTCPPALELTYVPRGRPVSETMRWLRALAARVPDWRMAVDAIRPHTQAIWQSWSLAEQARFLRHARRHWDVHRHRIAPDIARRLERELDNGTVRVVRSRVTPTGEIFDCRGHLPDWSAMQNPLLVSLLAKGTVRSDALSLGLDVTPGCCVITRDGNVSSNFYAVGPITRGHFWEIEAIPEIRTQCELLAAAIVNNVTTLAR